MKNLITVLLLLTTQCSTTDQRLNSFIQHLTTNTWYKPNTSNPNQASTTVFRFNNDGSFIQDFIELNGNTIAMTYKIDSMGHDSFAYYYFDYTFDDTTLRLYIGIGSGINNIANKNSIYQSVLKRNIPPPSGLFTTQQAIDWYKQQYSKGNLLTHKGTTLAIQ